MSALKYFLNSFRFAFRGIAQVIFSERNMQVHVFAALVTVAFGWYFQITSTEWCIVALCIGSVLAAEAFNSAIESLTDMTQPDFHPQAGKIKDAAAGAVLLISVAAAVCGALIFRKYIFCAV